MTTEIRPGQLWLERRTGRHIRILQAEVHGTGPAWTYCNVDGDPEPHGPDHPDWYWHYCDLFDFIMWDRFQLIA